MKVALLGLGTMGNGMAQNLLSAGFRLTIYNRTPSKAGALAAKGARIAHSPAEAAKDADVILAMLSDDAASREVWLGEDGALRSARQGATLIESATLTPSWLAELQKEALAHGCSLLDAPVLGSRAQADAGELTFLVGGDPEVLEEVRTVLEAMSKKFIHVGPLGSGSQLKLINNFLCGAQLASLAEAVSWIERAGLNRDLAIEALCNGAPGSPLIKAMSHRMTAKEYDVNFLLRLMEKDMRYAKTVAASQGMDLHTVDPVIELLHRAVEGGFGEQDISSVVEVLRPKQ